MARLVWRFLFSPVVTAGGSRTDHQRGEVGGLRCAPARTAWEYENARVEDAGVVRCWPDHLVLLDPVVVIRRVDHDRSGANGDGLNSDELDSDGLNW